MSPWTRPLWLSQANDCLWSTMRSPTSEAQDKYHKLFADKDFYAAIYASIKCINTFVCRNRKPLKLCTGAHFLFVIQPRCNATFDFQLYHVKRKKKASFFPPFPIFTCSLNVIVRKCLQLCQKATYFRKGFSFWIIRPRNPEGIGLTDPVLLLQVIKISLQRSIERQLFQLFIWESTCPIWKQSVHADNSAA